MTLPLTLPTHSIRLAMRIIDAMGKGIALVVDEPGCLLDTVTDGDIRRAVLEGMDLDAPVSWLLNTKPRGLRPSPVMAPMGTESSVLLMMMREWHVRQVPLLDENGRVVDLVTIDDLLPEQPPIATAVIMAGGFGKRLAPLTDTCPKPMLPVGGVPLLERTLLRLRDAGIHQVTISTHYRGDQIREHFGDGSQFGLEVHYADEQTPLGTAGVLGALEPSETVLVMNGDLVTGIDYRAMMEYHKAQGADLTMAVRRMDWAIPFGVVDCDGVRVISVTEKPMATLLVNAGIYLLEPSACRLVECGQHTDMPDVIGRLLAAGRPVAAFALTEGESWQDIGTPEQYDRAQKEHA